MPPKTIRSRGPAAEPGFGQSVVQTFTSQENRQIVTAVGLFAVSSALSYATNTGMRFDLQWEDEWEEMVIGEY